MENNQFWAFFVVAIIAGVALAFVISNAAMTGNLGIADIFGAKQMSTGIVGQSEWVECLDCQCSCSGSGTAQSGKCAGCVCGCFSKTATASEPLITKCGEGKCMCKADGTFACMNFVENKWVENNIKDGCACLCAKQVIKEATCVPRPSIDWLPSI